MLVFSKVFVGNLHLVKRPVLVAVSCWFLVIGSLSALVSAYLGRNDPAMLAAMGDGVIPAEAQYAILLFSQGITLVAALAMLQRQRGARTVYLVWRAHVRRHLRLAVQSEIECLVFATQGGQ